MTAEKKRGILLGIIYLITAVAVLFGAFAVYNLALVQKPWTLTTTYLSTLNLDASKSPIISVNIKSNRNNNGQKISDVQFNGYSDVEGKGVTGFGIQVYGDYSVKNSKQYQGTEVYGTSYKDPTLFSAEQQVDHTYINGNFTFYKTGDGGTTYYTVPYSDLKDYLIIDIDGDIYRLLLKEYSFSFRRNKSNFFKYLGGCFTGNYWENYTVNAKYTWYDVFDKIISSANNTNLTDTHAAYPLNGFDLNEYLDIQVKKDGKFVALPKTTDSQKLFAIPVDYSNDGATKVEDSMFDMVKGSATWGYWNNTTDKDFWGVGESIVITEKEINFVYLTSYDGNFLTLDPRLQNYLKTYAGDIRININLANITKDVKGIDLSAFNFNAKEFNITNSNAGFILLNEDSCKTLPTVTEV